MSKGKVELKPTEAQMKRMQELAAAITDLCEKEVKTHNPDGKIGAEDILIMLTSLQAVIDSSVHVLQGTPELLSSIISDLPKDLSGSKILN